MVDTLLMARGTKLGLDNITLMNLITMFGPTIAEALIKFLESKLVGGLKLGSTVDQTGWLQDLIVQFLTSEKTQVEAWINSGEGALYDALLAAVSTKAPFIVAILTKYKSTVVGLDDAIVDNLLTELIAALSKTPPAVQ